MGSADSVPAASEAGTVTGTVVRYSGSSGDGRVRSINQDSFFVSKLPAGGVLAVVADGMGGHRSGEVASQKAVEVMRRELTPARTYAPTTIARAVRAANLEVFHHAAEHPEHSGMGTTLTSVLIDDQVGLVAHVGDSRAYLIRADDIYQLTYDHSWVADRVRQGILSKTEAEQHRWRNVITNTLGAAPEIKLDIRYFPVEAGDQLLLCSDGVSMLLNEEVLAATISQNPPQAAAEELLRQADARGSPDNITAVVLEVERLEPRVKSYALPEPSHELASVKLGATLSGIRKVEEAFPPQDFFSKLRRQSWYPYRFWILGCLYLILMFLVFSLR